ncbi:hypothetical protein Agub_g15909 [Astrephomene gubernaculifera]|uniref:Uncharacterized protein n=1 Tax=Astrephomene gubernaculifera TaxID=47775 RepID=A0AAD3E401_9CHLO|nr:hypothetical protein Agub_g15909 [Astrephomene gubernaculifera]
MATTSNLTGRAKQGSNIIAVISELESSALDAMIDYWARSYCLSAVRLACRALRKAVDSSVRELSLQVRLADLEVLNAGLLPSLARWPRCSTVKFDYAAAHDELDAAEALAIFASPFIGLPLEARRRITHISIHELEIEKPSMDPDDEEPEMECCCVPDSPAVVALLAYWLPGLREVNLAHLYSLSYKSLHLLVMYEGLASLPYLERLSLPNTRTLKCIEALAMEGGGAGCSSGSGGTLTSLHVNCCPDYVDLGFNAGAGSGLAHLGSLQQLELQYVVFDTINTAAEAEDEEHSDHCWAMGQLLRSLPASLQSLRFSGCRMSEDLPNGTSNSDQLDATIRLAAGRVTSVELTDWQGSTALVDFAAMLRHGLLRSLVTWQQEKWRQQQQQEDQQPLLGCLRAASIGVSSFVPHLLSGDRGEQGEADDGEEQGEDLRMLLRRFERVEVKDLHLQPGTCLEAVRQAVELLGEPESLQLDISTRWPGGSDGNGNSHTLCINVSGTGAHALCEQQQQQPTKPQQLPGAAELLQSALLRMTAGATALGTAVPEAAATNEGRGQTGYDSELLLLQGPSFALLTQGPAVLQEWLRLVDKRATVTAGSGKCICACYALPFASSLVVHCMKGKAAAVAAAASALLEVAGVTPGSARVLSLKPATRGNVPRGLFLCSLQRVVQEAWDAAAPQPGEAGGNIGWRRLEWLLGLREGLGMPPIVWL